MGKREIAKLLFTVWEVVFCAFGIVCCVCLTYAQVDLGINIHETPSMFYYVFSFLSALFFIPFLILVYKIARKEGNKKICAKVKKALWILGTCSLGTLLANIIAILQQFVVN